MRLLIAHDGRDGGRDALALARVLATADRDASALVVTILATAPMPMEQALLEAEEIGDAEPLLERARESLVGIEVETRAYGGSSPAGIITALAAKPIRLDGDPATQLIGACEKDPVDLLVLGSRGYGPLARVLLGSVSRKIVQDAPCPVLTVRRPERS